MRAMLAARIWASLIDWAKADDCVNADDERTRQMDDRVSVRERIASFQGNEIMVVLDRCYL
jgi:hypothetical protein